MKDDTLRGLILVRWGARATLALGVAASGAANILHAQPDPIARTISAWPPLALLLAVELISRIPVHRLWMAVVRLAAASLLAGIAGWVSYWHMAAVAAAYGETSSSAHLLPLTVDGLIVVASISLVELNARIRTYAAQEEVVTSTHEISNATRREPVALVGAVTR